MKKYIICIEEIVSEEFEVVAENEKSAIKIAAEKYRNGEFVLAPGTLLYKQMAIISPNDSVTEWSAF